MSDYEVTLVNDNSKWLLRHGQSWINIDRNPVYDAAGRYLFVDNWVVLANGRGKARVLRPLQGS